MLPDEPTPDEIAPAEWAYWTDEQKYVYLERRGMNASHEIAVTQARVMSQKQPRLFAER